MEEKMWMICTTCTRKRLNIIRGIRLDGSPKVRPSNQAAGQHSTIQKRKFVLTAETHAIMRLRLLSDCCSCYKVGSFQIFRQWPISKNSLRLKIRRVILFWAPDFRFVITHTRLRCDELMFVLHGADDLKVASSYVQRPLNQVPSASLLRHKGGWEESDPRRLR